MRAQVFLGTEQVALRDVPDPEPAEGELLIRVEGCGLCGTDRHIYIGDLGPLVTPPMVIGHEITGEVVEVGRDVSGWRAGDKLVVDPVIPCGHCAACRRDRTNMCTGLTVIGYHRSGGFAELVSVPAGQAHRIDGGISAPIRALVEPLACVLHGMDRLQPAAGARVLVIGAGSVGLLWTAVLAAAPLASLHQIDLASFRTRLAAEVGADWTASGPLDETEAALKAAVPDGFDYIVDASGDPRAIEAMLRLARPGGTCLIFGVAPAGSEVAMDPWSFYRREITLLASRMPPQTVGRAVALVEGGRLTLEPVVTTQLGLNDLPQALANFVTDRERHVKQVVMPGESG